MTARSAEFRTTFSSKRSTARTADRYARTTFLPDDETWFDIFEAASEQTVGEVCLRADWRSTDCPGGSSRLYAGVRRCRSSWSRTPSKRAAAAVRVWTPSLA
jgi:hypothetical protein